MMGQALGCLGISVAIYDLRLTIYGFFFIEITPINVVNYCAADIDRRIEKREQREDRKQKAY